MKIDAFFKLPSDGGIEIPRELSVSSDNIITLKLSLEISTYYPVFDVVSDDFEICDNDNSIDWNYLGIPKPDGILPSSAGVLKRVYWYHNFGDNVTKEKLIKEGEENRQNEINNME